MLRSPRALTRSRNPIDVCRLEQLKMIHDKLLNLIGAETVPSVLIGSKCDLNEFRDISYEEGAALAERWGCPFLECSAKQARRLLRAPRAPDSPPFDIKHDAARCPCRAIARRCPVCAGVRSIRQVLARAWRTRHHPQRLCCAPAGRTSDGIDSTNSNSNFTVRVVVPAGKTSASTRLSTPRCKRWKRTRGCSTWKKSLSARFCEAAECAS